MALRSSMALEDQPICLISPSLQEFIFYFIEGLFRHSPSYGLGVFDLDQHPFLEAFG
jgi:hypothetical protein